MALFELRQYTIREGKVDAWLELTASEIMPHLISKGMVINAAFQAEDDPYAYIWIRRFKDEADRERLYAAAYECDHWKDVISPKIEKLIHRDKIVVQRMVATSMSPIQ